MTLEQKIEYFAGLVQKHAPAYGICVISPIVAQSLLESALYESELAVNANNFLGLKWREGRCPTAIGKYVKIGSEQSKDGSYTSSEMSWMRFADMEGCVIGYFDFTKNYKGLRGLTDPKEYLEALKENGYATSIKYVENVMKRIDKYNLRRFDVMVDKRTQYQTKNGAYTAGKQIRVKGAVLHSYGTPQPNPEVLVKNWDKASASACVHEHVGKDLIVVTLPCLEEVGIATRGWHAGGAANNTHLGAEMTEPSTIKYVGGSSWIELGDGSNTKAHVLATYKNAVQEFAAFCKFHNLDPLASGVILSHREAHAKGIASNHGDVEHLWNKFGLTMNQFRQDVKKAMAGVDVNFGGTVEVTDTSTQAVNSLSGTVTVKYTGDDGLNIRTAPAYTAEVKEIVHKGTFTVVGISEDEKWYKLESGGFITAIPSYVTFKATEEQKQQTAGTGYFRVRKAWNRPDTQIGAFKTDTNAIELCKQNTGYKVFDNSGNEIYPKVSKSVDKVKVKIKDLKIRKGPGTTYDYHKKNGKAIYTGENVLTIVRTSDGPGAKLWGLLKSYESRDDGWIALDDDYVDIL